MGHSGVYNGADFSSLIPFLAFHFQSKVVEKKKEKENEESVELCWCSFPQFKKKKCIFFSLEKTKKMPDETLRPRRADVSM